MFEERKRKFFFVQKNQKDMEKWVKEFVGDLCMKIKTMERK